VKITPALRKQIHAAVRQNVFGAAPLVEVGIRGKYHGTNALRWETEDDLFDLRRLADLKEFDDDPKNPGCVQLDLYVTTGLRSLRELETNVEILIRDGQVVGATSSGRGIPSMKEAVGFPKGEWDDA
jgi:hypothetical protein